MNVGKSTGLRSVLDHLTKHNISHAVDWESAFVRIDVELSAKFICVIEVNERDNLVQITGFIPVPVPAKRRREVFELLAWINWCLVLGNFQMDMNDGELRFVSGAPYPKGKLADEVIHQVIGRSIASVRDFFPAFAGVIFAGKSPKEAFDAALNRTESPDKDEAEAVASKPHVELN